MKRMTRDSISRVRLLHFFGLLFLMAGCADIQDDEIGDTAVTAAQSPRTEQTNQPPPPPAPGQNPSPPRVPRILKVLPGEDVPVLMNTASKGPATVNFPFPVRVNDVLKFTGTAIEVEEYEDRAPTVSRDDREVCVEERTICARTEPVFERRCQSRSYPCVKCDFFGCRPWICSSESCSDVQTGTRCVENRTICARTENQWMQTTTHSAQTSATCSLSSFPYQKVGEEILVPLQSSASCNLDQFSNGSAMSLQIENAMKEEMDFKVGTEVRNWKGERVKEAPSETVSPLITFRGMIEALSIGASM